MDGNANYGSAPVGTGNAKASQSVDLEASRAQNPVVRKNRVRCSNQKLKDPFGVFRPDEIAPVDGVFADNSQKTGGDWQGISSRLTSSRFFGLAISTR